MKICGKRVGHHVYIHCDALEHFKDGYNIDLHEFIVKLVNDIKIDHDFNVVKLSTKAYEVSLLNYPTFYKKFHPALSRSTKIGLESRKTKSQNYINNKPILHRCETMMIPNSALQSLFCYQTQVENSMGLYEDTSIIGRESKWNDLLKSKGLLEPLLNQQIEIAKMIRKAPSLPITVVPDIQ